MTVVITSRPIKTVNTAPVAKSMWNAAYNPLIYNITCSAIASTSYYIQVEIYEAGSDTLLGKSQHKPFLSSADPTTGTVQANLTRFIRGYLKNIYVNPVSVNAKDFQNTLRFYIKVKEYDSTGLLNFISDESNPIFAIKSVKQIGELYGQNMGVYVPFGQDIGSDKKAKFLTKFKQPRYFAGYPFTLSFIYSENIAGVELKKVEEELGINQNSLAITETQLDTSQVNAVNLLKLKDIYDADRNFVDVLLKTGVAITDTYVDLGYVDDGYTGI